MLNRCEFIGRVGKNPETRYTQSGTKVVSFSLAATESWKDQNGEKQERTEWVSCTCFGTSKGDGLAGVVEKHVGKGDLIYVSGKMQTDKYQAQDGSDRYSTKIILSELRMIPTGNKQDNTQSGNTTSGNSGGYGDSGGSSGGGYGAPDLNDSIPF